MIGLQIKGPRKKQIENLLRSKSQEQKDKLQMLRIKYGSLKEYETKKFTEIFLPKISKERRKNDLAKAISLSVLSKIQQNKSLTDQQAQHLAKMSPQKRSNKLLIKTQSKTNFQDFQIFSFYQKRIIVGKQDKILKERVTKILDLGEKRKFSLCRKRSNKNINKLQRSITDNSIESPILDVYSDSLSRKYKLKLKALEKDRQLAKDQRTIFIRLIDKRLSPSICVIKKFKTEPQDNSKSNYHNTQILRKIKLGEFSQQRNRSEKLNFKTLDDVKVKISPFQASLSPWNTTQMVFNC